MKMFSIVIPTINRTKELDKLLESIEMQNYDDLEIIIVDQNEKDILNGVINKHSILPISRYRVNFKGASKARNYGANKANGKIINFPDDDCEFTEDTLSLVDDYFNNNDIDALFGRIKDRDSKKNILHFSKKDKKVKLGNIYQTTIEASMFIKLTKFKDIGMYDEKLGIGTYFGAEENADLVSRLLYKKSRLQYIAKDFFYHPNKRDDKLFSRGYNYNIGFGGFLYKHIKIYKKLYPAIWFLTLKTIKNILCIVLGVLTLNKEKIKYNYYCIKGKIRGFIDAKKIF